MYDSSIRLGIAGTAVSSTALIGSAGMGDIYLVLSIVGIVLGIVSSCIGIVFKVKDALKDKKITKEEAEDIGKDIKNVVDDTIEKINDIKNK